jgi:MYXO-CTERM domain-containing protein
MPVKLSIPIIKPHISDLGSNAGALPAQEAGVPVKPDSGSCHVLAVGSDRGRGALWFLLLGAALAWRRRSRA